MPRPVPEDSAEHVAGMEVFYTETDGIGGRLRSRAEDFVVEEVATRPRAAPEGQGDAKHLTVLLRLTNWEQNHFIREASRHLKVGRRNVGFAGTKDKRAVTTQWFSFLAPRRDDEELIDRLGRLPRVEVLDHVRTIKGMRLGMHEGNRFHITLRALDCELDEARERVTGTLSAMSEIGGFPNFFGIQRFGAVRPITHLVGRAIVHGELEEACVLYASAEGAREDEQTQSARTALRETRDWKKAEGMFPTHLKFERAVINSMSTDPTDPARALRQLPENLMLLFVHAYQSFLFNRMLSERIRRRLPLDHALEGDLVVPFASGAMDDRAAWVPATAARLDKVNRQLAKHRGGVTLPLYGFDTPLAQGEPGEIEHRILEEEGVAQDSFRSPLLTEVSSRGLRRPVLTPAAELDAEVFEETVELYDGTELGGPAARLSFRLPKGAYATTFLREVMKALDARSY